MSMREDRIGSKQGTLLGMMARLWWMLLGNIPLVFCILLIVDNRAGVFHTADWVFWIVLVSLVLVRYLDIKFLGGCTGTGVHASMGHWTRYTIVLVLCAGAIWILAHVANHFWMAEDARQMVS